MSDGPSNYGFRWGPLAVTRLARFRSGTKKESYVLRVATDHAAIEVYVSRTGRSIRVWRGGRELT